MFIFEEKNNNNIRVQRIVFVPGDQVKSTGNRDGTGVRKFKVIKKIGGGAQNLGLYIVENNKKSYILKILINANYYAEDPKNITKYTNIATICSNEDLQKLFIPASDPIGRFVFAENSSFLLKKIIGRSEKGSDFRVCNDENSKKYSQYLPDMFDDTIPIPGGEAEKEITVKGYFMPFSEGKYLLEKTHPAKPQDKLKAMLNLCKVFSRIPDDYTFKDLSFGNILINDNLSVDIIDCDNISRINNSRVEFEGIDMQALGSGWGIAPEIVFKNLPQTKNTDYYSLASIIFICLVSSKKDESQNTTIYSSDYSQYIGKKMFEEGYFPNIVAFRDYIRENNNTQRGTTFLNENTYLKFIFDPNDKSNWLDENNPTIKSNRFYQRWEDLGSEIQNLFIKAFRDPYENSRPSPKEWITALEKKLGENKKRVEDTPPNRNGPTSVPYPEIYFEHSSVPFILRKERAIRFVKLIALLIVIGLLTSPILLLWLAPSVYFGDANIVLLDENSGESEVLPVFFGREIAVETPEKEGYSFLGYFDAPEGGRMYIDSKGAGLSRWWSLNKNASVTLYSHWEMVLYDVIVELNKYNAGTIEGFGEFQPGTQVELNVFTEEGYTFVGWYNEGIKVSEDINYVFVMPDNDLEIEARWNPNEYKLFLNPQGGQIDVSEISVKYGEPFFAPNAIKQGYTFEGWYSSLNGNGNKLYEWEWRASRNLSYYAYWKEIKPIYLDLTRTLCAQDQGFNPSIQPPKSGDTEDDYERHNDYDMVKLKVENAVNNYNGKYSIPEGNYLKLSLEMQRGDRGLPKVEGENTKNIEDDSYDEVIYGTNINKKRVGKGAYYTLIEYSDGTRYENNGVNFMNGGYRGRLIVIQVPENTQKKIIRVSLVVVYEITTTGPGFIFPWDWIEYTNWRCVTQINFE